jgi:hypothetical protein
MLVSLKAFLVALRRGRLPTDRIASLRSHWLRIVLMPGAPGKRYEIGRMGEKLTGGSALIEGEGDEHEERQGAVVRINARGPTQAGREVDLSRAAANEIGLSGRT